MNREAFVAGMIAGIICPEEEMREIMDAAIDATLSNGYPRGHMNTIIVMEELAEFSQEFISYSDSYMDKTALLEEMADATLSVMYLQQIYGIRYKKSEPSRDMNSQLYDIATLIKQISKTLRGKDSTLQESANKVLADINLIKDKFEITDEDLNKAMSVKIYRERERTNKPL